MRRDALQAMQAPESRSALDLGQQEDPGFLEDRRDWMPSSSWVSRSASDEVSAAAVSSAAAAWGLELFLLPVIRRCKPYFSLYGGDPGL